MVEVDTAEYIGLLKAKHQMELEELRTEYQEYIDELVDLRKKLVYCCNCGNQKDGPFIAISLYGSGTCDKCGTKWIVQRDKEDEV